MEIFKGVILNGILNGDFNWGFYMWNWWRFASGFSMGILSGDFERGWGI